VVKEVQALGDEMKESNFDDIELGDLVNIELNDLVDIDNIKIDVKDKKENKIKSLMDQMGNTNIVAIDGYAVQIRYVGETESATESMKQFISSIAEIRY